MTTTTLPKPPPSSSQPQHKHTHHHHHQHNHHHHHYYTTTMTTTTTSTTNTITTTIIITTWSTTKEITIIRAGVTCRFISKPHQWKQTTRAAKKPYLCKRSLINPYSVILTAGSDLGVRGPWAKSVSGPSIGRGSRGRFRPPEADGF